MRGACIWSRYLRVAFCLKARSLPARVAPPLLLERASLLEAAQLPGHFYVCAQKAPIGMRCPGQPNTRHITRLDRKRDGDRLRIYWCHVRIAAVRVLFINWAISN